MKGEALLSISINTKLKSPYASRQTDESMRCNAKMRRHDEMSTRHDVPLDSEFRSSLWAKRRPQKVFRVRQRLL